MVKKGKKSNTISYLRRKNLKFKEALEPYLNEVNDERKYHIERLMRNLSTCSAISVYSEKSGEVDYHGSHTCDNKNCNICNYNRQKALRKKYIDWFASNPYFLLGSDGKAYSKRKYEKKFGNNIPINITQLPYDVMHLTLTVPHYKDVGFNDERYYFKHIIHLFHELRRGKEWKRWVYGGEYGVETTVTDNGLNIHIHSLLFVRKSEQNRNRLHREVLLSWNRLTVNRHSNRTKISDIALSKIQKSNRLLTIDDIKKLNPQGATMVGLETIYSLDRKRSKTRDMKSGQFIKAVLEAISYHFEPHAFDKENGEVNIDLLIDILPHVYNMRLYGKFGVLHGDDSLNIRSQDNFPDLDIPDVDIDTETGEVIERRYFVLDPKYAYHFETPDGIKVVIPRRVWAFVRWLRAMTIQEAINESIGYVNMQKTIKINIYDYY